MKKFLRVNNYFTPLDLSVLHQWIVYVVVDYYCTCLATTESSRMEKIKTKNIEIKEAAECVEIIACLKFSIKTHKNVSETLKDFLVMTFFYKKEFFTNF